jgi:hypothetical protein
MQFSLFKRYFFVKVQCKEVKHNKFISVIMLLIKRHVSTYSETIIRFKNFQLYETNIFHGMEYISWKLLNLMMASE